MLDRDISCADRNPIEISCPDRDLMSVNIPTHDSLFELNALTCATISQLLVGPMSDFLKSNQQCGKLRVF